MDTSGAGLFNAYAYIIELLLVVQLARALVTGPFDRRRILLGAAPIWLLVAVPSLLQFFFPSLLRALRRDPGLIKHHHEYWRVLTSVVVQDGGAGGTVFNLIALAVIAVTATLVWGPGLAAVLFVAAHLVFNLAATFLSPDVGAGNSGATFGLAATVAGLVLILWLREKVLGGPVLGRALGILVIGIVLVTMNDAHGIPMIGGVVLGMAAASRSRGVNPRMITRR